MEKIRQFFKKIFSFPSKVVKKSTDKVNKKIVYAKKNAERLRTLAADPRWREVNKANNQRLAQDPTWRFKLIVGVARRSEDPEWKKNQIEGARKRSARRPRPTFARSQG